MGYPVFLYLYVRIYKFEDYFGDEIGFITEKENCGYKKAVLIRYKLRDDRFYDLESGDEILYINLENMNRDIFDQELYFTNQEEDPMYKYKPTKKDIKRAKELYEKNIYEDQLIKDKKLVRFKGKLVYEKRNR